MFCANRDNFGIIYHSVTHFYELAKYHDIGVLHRECLLIPVQILRWHAIGDLAFFNIRKNVSLFHAHTKIIMLSFETLKLLSLETLEAYYVGNIQLF